MQPHLAKFLENNDPPSEAILKEIKDLLSIPLQDLKNKDAEIKRLTNALNNLEEERNAIQNSIDEYGGILSPIRRMPPDILHEIFYHCLPRGNPIMSIKEAPLLLTRICRSWRSIALVSHRIWSKLHIPILSYSAGLHSPDPPGVYGAVSEEAQRKLGEKYATMMHARCKLAEMWLSRSGSCPLSVSLFYPGGSGRISEKDLDDKSPLSQAFKIVASFLQRFTNIEISMPYLIYAIFQKTISLDSVDMMSRLRKLKITLFNQCSPFGIEYAIHLIENPIIFFQAPHLQTISIYTCNLSAFDPRSVPPSWENLTNMSLTSAITSADAVQVLRRCRNLEHCELVIINGLDVHISPEELLSLPRLISLSIRVGCADSMTSFYKQIDAPKLNSFDYQIYKKFSSSNPAVHGQVPLASPILQLIEKHNNIKKLSFDPRMLNAQDTDILLRFANQLTHLKLGRPRANGQRPNNQGHYHGPLNFSLDILIPGEVSSLDTAVSGKDILLPELEVFEAYLGTSPSDECLRQFILSRLGYPSRNSNGNGNGLSALKAVKVVFERVRDLDIKEEVDRCAKEAGLKFELNLSYVAEGRFQVGSKYSDAAFLPWYGMSGSQAAWAYKFS